MYHNDLRRRYQTEERKQGKTKETRKKRDRKNPKKLVKVLFDVDEIGNLLQSEGAGRKRRALYFYSWSPELSLQMCLKVHGL